MAYDFTTLSPEDFEALAADLLSSLWKTRLESFKPGKDQGIDLRHSRCPPGQPTTIVQCKRYAPQKISELVRAMQAESKKLERIRPERYVLVTSVALSPANKNDLLRTLAPWCKSTADIFGPTELNGLLRQHPEVEQAHFKLWVASTAVLERVLHSRIFNLTAATVEATKEQLQKLVIHDGLNRALELLRDEHHVLVVGIPGIGKTTLARMIMCHYLREGFEPAVIGSSIEDAWSIVHASDSDQRRLVLLYDDFLGRLKFDSQHFSKNEEHSLFAFLDKVRRSDRLRFVLTTREYILADAQRVHGAFRDKADEILRYTLSLEQYTREHRARMLFNHLYFSDLPDGRLQKLVQRRVYRDIVEHKHFNPRIVESISRFANSRALTDDEYLIFIEHEFSDPSRVWEHPFQHDIGPMSRQVLALLWTFGGSSRLEDLESSLRRMHLGGDPQEFKRDFSDSLKQLDGNFVQVNRFRDERTSAGNVLVVQFHNPSIEELVQRLVGRDVAWMERLCEGAICYQQVTTLLTSAKNLSDQPGLPMWNALRRAAARVEDVAHGHLSYLQRFGEREAVKTWSTDDPTPADVTHTLLEIEMQTHETDARAIELWNRVSTKSGWLRLLARVSNDSYSAYAIGHLQKWVEDISGWTTGQKAQVWSSFHEALAEILADTDNIWPIEFAALRSLAETADSAGGISEAERILFTTAAKLAAETLVDNADEAERVQQEMDELIELAKVCHLEEAPLKSIFAALRARIEILKERDQTPNDEPERRRYDTEPTSAVDIDGLFAGLLER